MKGELEKFSSVRTFGFIVACIDNSSEEEEEGMTLNRK